MTESLLVAAHATHQLSIRYTLRLLLCTRYAFNMCYIAQVYVMTRNFRFCTLTLDAYDSSRRVGAGTKVDGDAPYQHIAKPDLRAALKTEALESADEGGDSSLATSVHSSAPALPGAGESCALSANPAKASPASRLNLDLNNSIDSADSGAMTEQHQHAAGVTVPDEAAQGGQQAATHADDSTSRAPAPSYRGHSSGAPVPSPTPYEPQTLSFHPIVQSSNKPPVHSGSSARPVPGAGSADTSKQPTGPTDVEAADVTPTIEPSEGFQTLTAVREHHGVDDDRGAGTAAVAGSVVVHTDGVADAGPDPDNRQEKAVVLREPARFAALKTRSLWRQLLSAEAIGLTLFFTAHVLILQLYLGTPPRHAHEAAVYIIVWQDLCKPDAASNSLARS